MAGYREATADDLDALCTIGAEVHALHQRVWPQIEPARRLCERLGFETRHALMALPLR